MITSKQYYYLVSVLFTICSFIITRQVPFMAFSPLMNICVVLIVLLGFLNHIYAIKDLKKILLLVIIPLGFNVVYSNIIQSNDFGYSMRFFFILVFLAFAYFIKVEVWAIRAFIIFNVIQSYVLLGIYIFLALIIGFSNYLPIRFFFLEMGWGDVYSYGGILYKIQIKGNALILFTYMIALEYKLFRFNTFILFSLLLGIFISGNFAFLVIAAFYSFYKFVDWKRFKNVNSYLFFVAIIGVVVLIAAPYILQYISNTLAIKEEDSLGTRADQINILLTNWKDSWLSIFMGSGLGNTIEKVTAFRDYRGLIYYELQSLYFFNQLGLIFSFSYFIYNLIVIFQNWIYNYKIIIIYILYLIYAFTNPYLLDTNHFLVIIILNSLLFYKKTNA